MKRFLSTLVAVLVTASVAFGASIALRTGPLDPSGMLGTINTLVNDINAGVAGMLNNQIADVGTTAVTTEETLQTFTLPANGLGTNGQAVKVTCNFTTGATANGKSVRLYFGTTKYGTLAQASNAQTGKLQLVIVRTGAATQKVYGSGMAGTASITPVAEAYTSATDSLTAGVIIKCTGQNSAAPTANDIVVHGMLTEMIK